MPNTVTALLLTDIVTGNELAAKLLEEADAVFANDKLIFGREAMVHRMGGVATELKMVRVGVTDGELGPLLDAVVKAKGRHEHREEK